VDVKFQHIIVQAFLAKAKHEFHRETSAMIKMMKKTQGAIASKAS